MERCGCSAPFGLPVVPEVKFRNAGSSAAVSRFVKLSRAGSSASEKRLGFGFAAVDEVDALSLGSELARLQQFSQVGQIGNDDADADMIEPVGDGVGGKQRRHRHRHEAGFPARDMGDGSPRILAEQQHDSVALDEAASDQEVCQLIGPALHVAKRHLPHAAVGPLADQRDLARVGRMAVADIRRDVVPRRNVPAERCVKLFVARQSFHRDDRSGCRRCCGLAT
jgi:hypothetical protein